MSASPRSRRTAPAPDKPTRHASHRVTISIPDEVYAILEERVSMGYAQTIGDAIAWSLLELRRRERGDYEVERRLERGISLPDPRRS